MSVAIPVAEIVDDELRTAAVLARGCLMIQAARDYGFIEGGNDVDVDRCEEILAAARTRLGFVPSDADAELVAIELVTQHNQEKATHG